MADETRYSLCQVVFKDKEIIHDTLKITRKQETEELTSNSSHNPYAVQFKGETLEFEMSDVDPLEREFFNEVMTAQQENPGDLPMIAAYDYNEINGDLVESEVYYGCYITEISKENVNNPFSVKGSCLRMKK